MVFSTMHPSRDGVQRGEAALIGPAFDSWSSFDLGVSGNFHRFDFPNCPVCH
jgi:hypothetical protein